MVVFNVPESGGQCTESKKADDIEKINTLPDGPMKLGTDFIHIKDPVRLGGFKSH